MLDFLKTNYEALDIILTMISMVMNIVVVIAANEYFHIFKIMRERFGKLKKRTISLSNPSYYANHNGRAEIKSSSCDTVKIFLDFKDIDNPNCNTFSGFCYRFLPQNYWVRYAKKGYELELYVDKKEFPQLKSFIVEFKDQKHGEMRPAVFRMSKNEDKYQMRLNEIESNILFWNNIDEICIVFLPYENSGKHGTVKLSDFSITKTKRK